MSTDVLTGEELAVLRKLAAEDTSMPGIDRLLATIESRDREIEAGKAFHALAVAERNKAWQDLHERDAQITRLTEERDTYRASEDAARDIANTLGLRCEQLEEALRRIAHNTCDNHRETAYAALETKP